MDLVTKETQIWRESETAFPGECVFVPRPGSEEEDDGFLLSVVLESDVTKPHFLLLMNAKTFKEVARAEINRDQGQIPPTVHGVFSVSNGNDSQ